MGVSRAEGGTSRNRGKAGLGEGRGPLTSSLPAARGPELLGAQKGPGPEPLPPREHRWVCPDPMELSLCSRGEKAPGLQDLLDDLSGVT